MRRSFVCFLALLLVGVASEISTGSGPASTIRVTVADPLNYVKIYSDADGESHFAVEEISFTLRDFSPPAPPVSLSQLGKAARLLLLSNPPGWFGDWHPSPHRQFLFLLEGELEMQVSDGEVRRFGPGSIVLLEDTAGKGHVTRVVSKERMLLAAVPLETVPREGQ